MPALPALLALALSVSPSKSPLDRCDAIPVDHGWQYDCADVRALLQDRPDAGEKARKSLATMVEAAPATVGEGAKTRTEKRKLGGSDVDVYVTEAPGNPDAKFHAAVPFEAGTRILLCHGASGRCASVMGALAGTPWSGANAEGSIRKDPAPLAIAGRSVPVPKGCAPKRQPRGGGVVCAKTDWVVWVSLDEASARRMLASTGDNMRKTLAQPGWKNTEREVPCKVAGAATTCTRVLAENGRDALVALWAIAPAGQEFAFASCMSRGVKTGSPCSLVFEAP